MSFNYYRKFLSFFLIYIKDPYFFFELFIKKFKLLFKLVVTSIVIKTNLRSRFRGFKWFTCGIFGILIITLVILQPLTWFQFLWTKYKGIDEPRNKCLRFIYDLSVKIIKSAKIRTGIYLLISVGLAATSVVNVIACSEVDVEPSTETVLSNCVSSWVIIFFI